MSIYTAFQTLLFLGGRVINISLVAKNLRGGPLRHGRIVNTFIPCARRSEEKERLTKPDRLRESNGAQISATVYRHWNCG
jgi:hypothetical protein